MILGPLKLKRQACDNFKDRRYEATLPLQAVFWYLHYPLSCRDTEEMLLDPA